ncbi:MAG TPA: pseudouridine synthase [Candidatus Dormibacteraeota bacterium]|nr:pseudouridine synthase [Candidatus Dormibacteraeota bacterium]
MNRFLARAGVASRRAADDLIASGSVLVNGERPPAAGVLVDPARDHVTVKGERVRPATTHRYLMLNKPLGVIATARDESSRTTVLDVIGAEGAGGHRLFPVGRLDADSTGLLLLTDDGDLAYRLTSPRFEVAKEYEVTVAGVPTPKDIGALRRGVELDGKVTAPAQVDLLQATRGDRDSGRAQLRIVIHEGRNRQVRRMMQAVGHRTQSLRRTAYGPVRLGRLKTGGWRVLSGGEVAALRRATGLEVR